MIRLYHNGEAGFFYSIGKILEEVSENIEAFAVTGKIQKKVSKKSQVFADSGKRSSHL